MSQGLTTSTESRALELLGSGVGAEVVASALGVSPSRISQLLSQEEFSAAVAKRRFENLSKHNVRDNKYDDTEDLLLDKLRDSLPLIHRPTDILRAITTINGAKRRGSSAPEQLTQQQTVVTLIMPTQIINKFQTDIQNRVVVAGDTALLTIQSSALLAQAKEKLGERNDARIEDRTTSA